LSAFLGSPIQLGITDDDDYHSVLAVKIELKAGLIVNPGLLPVCNAYRPTFTLGFTQHVDHFGLRRAKTDSIDADGRPSRVALHIFIIEEQALDSLSRGPKINVNPLFPINVKKLVC
jgi:hypothetical protein